MLSSDRYQLSAISFQPIIETGLNVAPGHSYSTKMFSSPLRRGQGVGACIQQFKITKRFFKRLHMKKIFFILSGLIMLLGISCKKTFLDVQSPSSVDEDFVFSSTSETFKVLAGCYELWRSGNGGLFYHIDVVGSHAERHP